MAALRGGPQPPGTVYLEQLLATPPFAGRARRAELARADLEESSLIADGLDHERHEKAVEQCAVRAVGAEGVDAAMRPSNGMGCNALAVVEDARGQHRQEVPRTTAG